MAVLVCGGAGYVGSHMVKELISNGQKVVILDNFQSGHLDAVRNMNVYNGDVRDRRILDKVFKENRIDSVIDFAADSQVGQSFINPLNCLNNNIIGPINLLEAMRDYGVKYTVFSSSAAVYGEPDKTPIVEESNISPMDPYGESKLAVEKVLKWCDRAYGIKYSILRYFNAAGAHTSGKIGEDHRSETHLIPMVLQVALNQREKIMIFGDDYNTPDGTCIRDYVHVEDIVGAHLLALNRLRNGYESDIYNLGTDKGYSVKKVIDTARTVTKKDIKADIVSRRLGDPAMLVASSEKARRELGWKPKFNSLEAIIETAWNWHSKHPHGYESKIEI